MALQLSVMVCFAFWQVNLRNESHRERRHGLKSAADPAVPVVRPSNYRILLPKYYQTHSMTYFIVNLH